MEESLIAERETLEDRLKEVERLSRIELIWENNSYVNIGYNFWNIDDDGIDYKGQYGFSFTWGHSYLYPKRPFGDIVKIGFDVNWIDFSFSQLKEKLSPYYDNGYNNGYNDYYDEDYDYDYYDPYYDDYYGRSETDKCMSMLVGLFGFGPNISLAPFTFIGSDISRLKLGVYFHYVPTIGIQKYMDYDESDAAYANIFQLGGSIKWKRIGLGVEKVWGKSMNFDKFDTKIKYDQFRIFLSINF